MDSQTRPKATPAELGFYMPAEWEKHDAIWLSWPHDPTTFPSRVEKAEQVYTEIISLIHESENVNLFVKDDKMKSKVVNLLQDRRVDLQRIHFFEFDYADVWFRDYGPTFIKNHNGQLAMVNWIFNSWGEKYDELLRDCQIPKVINRQMQIPIFEPGIVLEGGSIDVNGKGSILTTEQCLLNKNRNPNLGKAEIESVLSNYLSVNNFIWLKMGIEGDDTDGHVDDIARFINPTTIVCAYEENENDFENYEALKENYEILTRAKDQDGNPFKVVKLPMPGYVGDERIRLPASYANFYIGNSVVLVPVFGHKNDSVALSIIQEQFPRKRVAGVNCIDLVYGLGTIHCITQQQPSV